MATKEPEFQPEDLEPVRDLDFIQGLICSKIQQALAAAWPQPPSTPPAAQSGDSSSPSLATSPATVMPSTAVLPVVLSSCSVVGPVGYVCVCACMCVRACVHVCGYVCMGVCTGVACILTGRLERAGLCEGKVQDACIYSLSPLKWRWSLLRIPLRLKESKTVCSHIVLCLQAQHVSMCIGICEKL